MDQYFRAIKYYYRNLFFLNLTWKLFKNRLHSLFIPKPTDRLEKSPITILLKSQRKTTELLIGLMRKFSLLFFLRNPVFVFAKVLDEKTKFSRKFTLKLFAKNKGNTGSLCVKCGNSFKSKFY
jgi:hypothetical protein